MKPNRLAASIERDVGWESQWNVMIVINCGDVIHDWTLLILC